MGRKISSVCTQTKYITDFLCKLYIEIDRDWSRQNITGSRKVYVAACFSLGPSPQTKIWEAQSNSFSPASSFVADRSYP